jgi:hypothetical protein
MTTTVPESHRDLLDSEFTTIATVGPDGRPRRVNAMDPSSG